MEILISIGVYLIGVFIGSVIAMASYVDVIRGAYYEGYEDGQKAERNKWLRM